GPQRNSLTGGLLEHSVDPAKILMIEDSEEDIFLLRYALSQQPHPFELDVLQDGEAALEFVREQRTIGAELNPCVIVLDLHLPKHDGISILKAIRQEPGLAHIRVVALTTLASPLDAAEIRRLGVRLYRTKPSEIEAWHTLACEILEVCREPSLAPA